MAASTTLAAWTLRLVTEAAPPAQRATLLADLAAPGDPRDGDARVPYRAAVALWESLPAAHADPDLGLSFAATMATSHLGVVGYFASTAGTVGGALERVLRFHRLLKDPSELSITFAPDAVHIREAPPPGEARFPRHLAEAILGAYVVLARQWTGQRVEATAVRFQHAAPGDTRAHERLFGRRPTFGASENALVLPGAAARLPLRTADAALASYLEPVAAARLQALPAGDRLLAEVGRTVLDALPDGYPSIQGVARKLGLSSRSLQRRLEERSTRYQDVVDGVRRDAATRLLADPSLSVAEVAFVLGFADTSGFHRAFRRWTGRAPRRVAAAV
jgi:AraC-like DNA-binding protein